MIYGFAQQSGGHVAIYSEVGKGTTVRLYLRRALGTAAEAAPTGLAQVELSRRHEAVLVVEDEADVRSLACRVLADLGYRVLDAPDGRQALALLAEHPEIDLLLTDVVLPMGLSGVALAREAHVRRPDLKVLYMSGYTEDAVNQNGLLDRGVNLIIKPFRRAELSRMVPPGARSPAIAARRRNSIGVSSRRKPIGANLDLHRHVFEPQRQ